MSGFEQYWSVTVKAQAQSALRLIKHMNACSKYSKDVFISNSPHHIIFKICLSSQKSSFSFTLKTIKY